MGKLTQQRESPGRIRWRGESNISVKHKIEGLKTFGQRTGPKGERGGEREKSWSVYYLHQAIGSDTKDPKLQRTEMINY